MTDSTREVQDNNKHWVKGEWRIPELDACTRQEVFKEVDLVLEERIRNIEKAHPSPYSRGRIEESKYIRTRFASLAKQPDSYKKGE